jgi:hypothetical protein
VAILGFEKKHLPFSVGDTGAAILAHPDIPDHASRRSLLRIGIPSYERLQFMR